jgi:hypothetical protein
VSARDPLAGVQLVLVDGNNLLHRESGGHGEGPVRSLLARLQSAIRDPIHTTVVLDGHPAPGSRPVQKVSPRLDLRHAGSRSADDLIVQLAASHSPAARAGVVVVSDDRALRDRARGAGCQERRLEWLQELMGTRRPHTPANLRGDSTPRPDKENGDDDQPAWQPGRGATRKKGNPRRAPRRRRT